MSNDEAPAARADNSDLTKPGIKRPNNTVAESTDLKRAKSEALHKQQLEEENEFDIQFQKWETDFNTWREQNANHPDKKAYREYEMKFLACRNKLLERREQMRMKRQQAEKLMQQAQIAEQLELANKKDINAELANNQGMHNNKYEQQLSENQTSQMINNPKKQQTDEIFFRNKENFYETELTSQFIGPQKNVQEAISQDNNNSQMPFLAENTDNDNFLKSGDQKGIPGLDLVLEEDSNTLATSIKSNTDEVIEIKDDAEPTVQKPVQDQQECENKNDSYKDAISSGINAILADQKLLSMLSIVTKCQNKSEIGQLLASNKTLYDELSKNIQESTSTNVQQESSYPNICQQSPNAILHQEPTFYQDEYSNHSQSDRPYKMSENYADSYSSRKQYEAGSTTLPRPGLLGPFRSNYNDNSAVSIHGRVHSNSNTQSQYFEAEPSFMPKQKFIRDMFNLDSKPKNKNDDPYALQENMQRSLIKQSSAEDERSAFKDTTPSLNKLDDRPLFGNINQDNERSHYSYANINERSKLSNLNQTNEGIQFGNQILSNERSSFGSSNVSNVTAQFGLNERNERSLIGNLNLNNERSQFSSLNSSIDRSRFGNSILNNERSGFGTSDPNERSSIGPFNIDSETSQYDDMNQNEEDYQYDNPIHSDDDLNQFDSMDENNDRSQFNSMNLNSNRLLSDPMAKGAQFGSSNIMTQRPEFRSMNQKSLPSLMDQPLPSLINRSLPSLLDHPLPSLLDQPISKPLENICVTDLPNYIDLTPRQILEILEMNPLKAKNFMMNWKANPDSETDFATPEKVINHGHKTAEIGKLFNC